MHIRDDHFIETNEDRADININDDNRILSHNDENDIFGSKLSSSDL